MVANKGTPNWAATIEENGYGTLGWVLVNYFEMYEGNTLNETTKEILSKLGIMDEGIAISGTILYMQYIITVYLLEILIELFIAIPEMCRKIFKKVGDIKE